jgi:cytidine deaminase
MAQDLDIRTIVAVCKDESGRIVVTNPCGVCRELLSTYGPDTDVLVDVQGQVLKLPAPELMPNPWMFPRENDWVLEDPRIEEEK